MDIMESIINSIKKLLGIAPEYTDFDPDVVMGINTALMILNQLGVGPSGGFLLGLSDTGKTWKDFLGDKMDLEAVKSYVYLKTRLLFDPPSNSFLIEAMERQIKEFEWRILSQVENIPVTEGGDTNCTITI